MESLATDIKQNVEIDNATAIIRYLMDDVVVWDGPFTTKGVGGFPSSGTVEMRHQYSGRGEYADYELAAIADELHVAPEHFQRIYPGRFAIVLDGGVLEVISEIDASILSESDNICFDAMRFVNAPFGGHRTLTTSPTDALTLYALARPSITLAVCE